MQGDATTYAEAIEVIAGYVVQPDPSNTWLGSASHDRDAFIEGNIATIPAGACFTVILTADAQIDTWQPGDPTPIASFTLSW